MQPLDDERVAFALLSVPYARTWLDSERIVGKLDIESCGPEDVSEVVEG
jgi:hypothetical protein